MLSVIGFAGFLADYLYRPISWVGLALLGVGTTPWLLKIIKRFKVGGIELEMVPQTKQERDEKIEDELKENEISIDSVQPVDADNPIEERPRERVPAEKSAIQRFVASEQSVLDFLSKKYKGVIRPQVKYGPFLIDAIISDRYSETLVEIKIAYSGKYNFKHLRDAAKQIQKARNFYAMNAWKKVDSLLAIAYDDKNQVVKDNIESLAASIRQENPSVIVEIVPLGDLHFDFYQ